MTLRIIVRGGPLTQHQRFTQLVTTERQFAKNSARRRYPIRALTSSQGPRGAYSRNPFCPFTLSGLRANDNTIQLRHPNFSVISAQPTGYSC